MNERDNTIKRCISEYGPLTVDLLALLKTKEPSLGATDTLWRRLKADKPLVANRHIYVWRGFPSQRYVYDSRNISKRKNPTHNLITSAVHITFDLHFNLFYWKRAMQKFKGKLNEDAYCILGLPQTEKKLHCYIESDTGSEGYTQIEGKLRRYLKHYEDTQEGFVVLFVCAEWERAADLARRAATVIPYGKRKLYLFTSVAALTANPKATICHVPHEPDKRFRILPLSS